MMTDDAAWSELAALLQTIQRLKDEISLCIGHSPHRDKLDADFFAAEARRLQLVAVIVDQSRKNLFS
jgi:hypothetical protein